VDQLGGIAEAISAVRKKAGLSATGETNLVMFPPRKTLLEMLTSATPEALEDAAVERKIRAIVPDLPSQTALKGGMLSILPYRLTVH